MTMITLNANNNVANANEGLGLFARVAEALRGWQHRMNTRAQLERLSDRELADIGLNRSDIDDVVNYRA